MHSIIDEITDVEAQAAKIRRDAAQDARDAIVAAQETAERQAAHQAEFARAKLREAEKKAEAEGAALSGQILAERAAETQAVCKAAEARLPEAVQYLVGRVVS